MNWGWGNNPNNKNYYQVAGEWVTSDNINEDLSFQYRREDLSFQYRRNMITGFAKNKTYEKINFITLFLLLIFLLNCKGTEVGQPNFASPNYFNEIWAVPGIYYYPANNPTIQPIKANIENNEVSASEFCLALFATDDTPYIPTLGEEEKEQGDFDKLPFWHKEYRYVPHQKEIENILIRDALIECISEHVRMHGRYSFTYIIDKIINIDITADVTLWGIQAVNSLNECFYLFRTPIISGETYTLIDCNQSGQDWSVNDWVAHTPVGHEDSYFKFKTIPEELPVEVKFTINVTSEKINHL